jgi:hypothetical protein
MEIREVIIEKHWRHTTPRSICDFFWAEVSKYDSKAVCTINPTRKVRPQINQCKYPLRTFLQSLEALNII